ncbi:hypothetical protein [Streptomyces colonosanans]|uniref:Uncharacterized protein n=1 Tax=Streptomyces colonosanans TaxID=1428652 RepID=A0A1S2NYC4_9ACTN|nr:hypothetical protein [Streptomyces colonosanans]OIJ86421.1 hypothetical protein BIV24_26550 [Streptomyces colonosanans]
MNHEPVVPYITAREGEEADSLLNLRMRLGPDGRPRLGYMDEEPPDRDLRGTLWARYSQSLGSDKMPTGTPQWRLVNPVRQRVMMGLLRCQVCTAQTKRTDGVLFLETLDDLDFTRPVRTAQPPVCLEHARVAAKRCPRLRSRGHVALLATRFPIYGVIGTAYQWHGAGGIRAVSDAGSHFPYTHPQIGWVLGSQLVRELRDYQVVNVDDLALTA